MAPGETRKKRETARANQFFELGVVGRKTGITVPQGARDEYGIEEIDGIFSSPEKEKSRVLSGATLTSSSMQLAQSSAPEPTDVLSARRQTIARSGKSTFPPPMGRSPVKTNIGSSPRRQSSVRPRGRSSDSPGLLAEKSAVRRQLNFGDVEELARSALKAMPRRKSGKKDIYDLPVTDEEDGRLSEEAGLPAQDESILLVQDQGLEDVHVDEDGRYEDAVELPLESSPSRSRGKRMSTRQSTSLIEAEEPAPQSPREKASQSRPVQAEEKRRGGKAQLLSRRQQPVEEGVIPEDQSVAETEPPNPKRRGKQLLSPEDTQPTADEAIETTELDESTIAAPIQDPKPKSKSKKRGRDPGKAKARLSVNEDQASDDVDDDDDKDEEEETSRPAKRTKAAPKKAAKKSRAPAFKKPDLPTTNGTGMRWDESMWAKGRNVSRLRDPTPSAEALVGRTRSGRQIIKPLNHFANETAIYGRDGTLVAVTTAETVERKTRSTSRAPPQRAQSKARGRAKLQPLKEEEEEAELAEEDDDLEDWEVDGEIVSGEVRGFDPLSNQTTSELFETELAWGPNSLPLHPVATADFGFAKLLNMPYFGSGIMDFPVGGFKKPRNSGKTCLHVFVHTGKVWCKIAGSNEVTVTRGGSFHVPRGNLYEIRNVSRRNARLFFAQGTEIVVAD